MPAAPFRVAIVRGVNPGKWTRAWGERRADRSIEVEVVDAADQRSVIVDGRADVVFARLPLDSDGLSVIRLYEEAPVVVVPREHPAAALDSLTLADLRGERMLDENDEAVIDLVVAGVGLLQVPQSVARMHTRRDLVAVPVTDAPSTQIVLAWPQDATTPDVDEFVGIVRGRSATSSRGEPPRKKRRGRR